MNGMRLLLLGCLAVLIIAAGCTTTPQTTANVGILYTRGPGPMPQLLATGQIDGYIAWQPFVEVAPESGIGRVVTYSQDLPPEGKWIDHPTNVFIARNDLVARSPDFVNAMSAMTILSSRYITDHPDQAAGYTADWLAGKGNFTYGNISVPSVTVLQNAIPHVRYSTEPSVAWINGTKSFIQTQIDLGYITGFLKNTTGTEQDALLFNFLPYQNASGMVASGSIVTPQPVTGQVGMGYLLAADHAALFVAVKDWQYFNDTYGIALRPVDPTQVRPDLVDLVVNGQKVAEIKLISADAGPQLIQLAATNAIQISYVGVPPALAGIDQGVPVKILSPVDTEGSGVVVAAGSPATDWNSFVEWAQERSAAGKPIVMAAPGKGSIQDVMLQYALKDSGLSVKEVQA